MSGQTATDAKDWSRHMGEQHERRDRAAALGAQTQHNLERERHAACLERWPAIVSAMRTLIEGYNTGTGLKTLTLVEDPLSPSVTVASSRDGQSSMTLAIDGADVSVHTHNGHASNGNGPRWVNLTRTDQDVAEYLLRNWMEQL